MGIPWSRTPSSGRAVDDALDILGGLHIRTIYLMHVEARFDRVRDRRAERVPGNGASPADLVWSGDHISL